MFMLLLLAGCTESMSEIYFSDNCVIAQGIECKNYFLENNTLELEIESMLDEDIELESVNLSEFSNQSQILAQECFIKSESLAVACPLKEEYESGDKISLRANIQVLLDGKSETFQGDLFLTAR
jgi:hypothetical protein